MRKSPRIFALLMAIVIVLSFGSLHVFALSEEESYYYYKIPITTCVVGDDHPDWDFSYSAYGDSADTVVLEYDFSTEVQVKAGESVATVEAIFYSETPLSNLTVKQMLGFDDAWAYDESEFVAAISGEQQPGLENAFVIPMTAMFTAYYFSDNYYYYKVDITTEIEGDDHPVWDFGYDAYGMNGEESVSLTPCDDTEMHYFEEGVNSYTGTAVYYSEQPIDELSILQRIAGSEAWTYDNTEYVVKLDPAAQVKGMANALEIDEMGIYLGYDDESEEEVYGDPQDVVFHVTYELPPAYFYSVPVTHLIEKNSNPSDEEYYLYVYGVAYTEDDYFQIVDAAEIAPGDSSKDWNLEFSTDGKMTSLYLEFWEDSEDENWTFSKAKYAWRSDYSSEHSTDNENAMVIPQMYLMSEQDGTVLYESISAASRGSEPVDVVFEHSYQKLADPDDFVVQAEVYTIKASSNSHGEISPEGEAEVKEGRNKTFTFNPDKGYEVSRIVIDGEELPKSDIAEKYTFYDVDEDHTIKVYFSKIPEQTEIPVSDEIEEINPNTGAI